MEDLGGILMAVFIFFAGGIVAIGISQGHWETKITESKPIEISGSVYVCQKANVVVK